MNPVQDLRSSIFDLRSSKIEGRRPIPCFLILHPYVKRLFPVFFLLLLCWFLFFWRLADRDLWSSHEARAAQDAQTLLLDHQWTLPRLFDRKVELQKPPLYYWLVAAIGWLRGRVDGWAVRLPAACSAMGTVFLVYGLCVAKGRKLAGFLAASFLATMVHYTWLARVGRIDMVLTLAVALQLVSLYLRPRSAALLGWLWLVAASLAAAMAILLKGPIGVLLPAVAWVVYSGTSSSEAGARRSKLEGLFAFVIGVLLAAPWFFLANHETNGELLKVFFIKHNFERGFGSGTLASHPWWFYLPRLVLDTFPWSILVPVILSVELKRAVRQPRRSDPEGRTSVAGLWKWLGSDQVARFGLIWLLTMFLILSCVQFKRSDYLLPAYPGLALFLGSVGERWLRNREGIRKSHVGRELRQERSVVRSHSSVASLCTRDQGQATTDYLSLTCNPSTPKIGFFAVLAAIVIGWFVHLNWILPGQEAGLELATFAREIRRRAPAPQLVLFFRTEAHDLAFHVGLPLDTILEWENLDIWASRPGVYYVVMPPEVAAEWPLHLKAGSLQEVMRNTDLSDGRHARPLVLLRTHPSKG
jgi:4-amino-4-deoxy-L-arabinose transferase-like glycosyltransferase